MKRPLWPAKSAHHGVSSPDPSPFDPAVRMNQPAPAETASAVRSRWSPAARPVAWVAGLLILVLGIAALAPWTVSRGALREQIAAQLRSAAGLYVFPRGAAHISVLPRPRVRLDDVALVDPNGALVVEAASLTGDIRLFPLLGGRLEVTEVDLATPRVSVDVDRAPLTTAGAAVRAASASAESPEARKTDAARLGVLSLSNGTVSLRRNGVAFATAERVNARLDWRSVASPAALTADLDWRGSHQQFVLWVSQPATILRGGSSPVTLQAQSPETTINMAGAATVAAQPRYEGTLQVTTTSAPKLLSTLDLGVSLPTGTKAVALAGDLVATQSASTLSNLRLDAGGETFEGTLALQTVPNARPLLSGTLATRSFSLTPYLPSGFLTGSDGRPNAEPFDADIRSGPDLDLRLSAGQLRYQRLHANDAALSVLSKDNRTELSIADASAYGGAIRGRVVVVDGDEGRSDLQGTLLMRAIDWAALDRDLSGQGRLSGTADVTASVQTSGDSVLHMMRSLSGSGRLILTGGELGGLDLPGTLARLEKRPLAAAVDLGSGRTRFDHATLPFEIDSGVAKLGDGEIAGAGFSMALSGTIQIPEGQTAMTAAVRPAAPAQDSAGFTFEIAGPWNRPNFTPDVQGLIRRSDAASPLFVGPVATTPAVTAR